MIVINSYSAARELLGEAPMNNDSADMTPNA
jgi:hypothetical protein